MAEGKTDKDLERQYRKNLMVVASIVLVYSIAGGQMAPDLSLFGAKLQFSRPDWLEYAMVAVMCFFWWRHWQVSKFIRRERVNDILSNTQIAILTQEQLRNIVIPVYILKQQKAGALEKNQPVSISDTQITLKGVSPRQISLEVLFWINGEYVSEKVILVLKDTPAGFVFILVSYLKQWFKNAINETHFGDAILPSVTTMAALIAYSVQKLA